MDSLQDLLGKYSPKEPDEVRAVKHYIAQEFGAESAVAIQGKALVVTVSSGALANTLRLRLSAIQAAAATDKRLVFRIG